MAVAGLHQYFLPLGSNVLLSATVESEVAGKLGFILNWFPSCYSHHYRVKRERARAKKCRGEKKNDQVISNLPALPQSRDTGALRSCGSKSSMQAEHQKNNARGLR